MNLGSLACTLLSPFTTFNRDCVLCINIYINNEQKKNGSSEQLLRE